MNTQRESRVTDRFVVEAADGRRFNVVETSDFQRSGLLDGSWTPWLRSGGRLMCGRTPVNLLDSGSYQVLTHPDPTPCRRV